MLPKVHLLYFCIIVKGDGHKLRSIDANIYLGWCWGRKINIFIRRLEIAARNIIEFIRVNFYRHEYCEIKTPRADSHLNHKNFDKCEEPLTLLVLVVPLVLKYISFKTISPTCIAFHTSNLIEPIGL